MSDPAEDQRWIATLLAEPESPLFSMRARLTLEDDRLLALAAAALPSAAVDKDERGFIELSARRFVRQGCGPALSLDELKRVFSAREALEHFQNCAKRCAEQGTDDESVDSSVPAIASEHPSEDVTATEFGPITLQEVKRGRVLGLPIPVATAALGAAAASLLLLAYVIVSGPSEGPHDNDPGPLADVEPSAQRPPVEWLRIGGFDLTAEHEHGMFSTVSWKGAQEPGFRANPFHEYYSVGYCGLFAVRQNDPPYAEAAQPETRLVEFERTETGCRLAYENNHYGRKLISLEVADQVLRATCDLAQCEVPVIMTTCGNPIFFRRVYILTPGRERNFNLEYKGSHTNFVDSEGVPEQHTEVLITNDTGSYAWLYRVEPTARPMQLSTGSGLNGPVWYLQPGDKLMVLIGSESDLRRLR